MDRTPRQPKETQTMTRTIDPCSPHPLPLSRKRASGVVVARLLGVLCILLLGPMTLRAGDWPTFRHDAARSGITSEQLALPLDESWVFQARHVPEPAWGDPKPVPVEDLLELRRVHFDDVFQPVAVA